VEPYLPTLFSFIVCKEKAFLFTFLRHLQFSYPSIRGLKPLEIAKECDAMSIRHYCASDTSEDLMTFRKNLTFKIFYIIVRFEVLVAVTVVTVRCAGETAKSDC
jgi:hypothetical protein